MRERCVIVLILLSYVILLGWSSRSGTARARIKMLEVAIETFRMDNGRYPTTEEGLAALIEAPPELRDAGNYAPGGYLRERRVPDDPWGQPFQYQHPPSRNSEGYDLWSLGADGAPGGFGVDADLGNWPGGLAEAESLQKRESFVIALASGGMAGFLLGLPVYLIGVIRSVWQRRSPRSTFLGAHFAVLAYLVLACSLVPSLAVILLEECAG